MLGLVSLGMVGGAAGALISQNAHAATDTTTTTTATASTTTSAQDAQRQAMEALRQKAEAAIKAGDYSTWQSTMNEINDTMYQNMKAGITESNFSLLQQIQTAKDNGDMETVRTLSQQLTIPMPALGGHMGPHGHMGMMGRNK